MGFKSVLGVGALVLLASTAMQEQEEPGSSMRTRQTAAEAAHGTLETGRLIVADAADQTRALLPSLTQTLQGVLGSVGSAAGTVGGAQTYPSPSYTPGQTTPTLPAPVQP